MVATQRIQVSEPMVIITQQVAVVLDIPILLPMAILHQEITWITTTTPIPHHHRLMVK